ncbi:hypothetical protein D3C73_1151960 [compost metagenome]
MALARRRLPLAISSTPFTSRAMTGSDTPYWRTDGRMSESARSVRRCWSRSLSGLTMVFFSTCSAGMMTSLNGLVPPFGIGISTVPALMLLSCTLVRTWPTPTAAPGNASVCVTGATIGAPFMV